MTVYCRSCCVTFNKTTDPFGGLSNMASGFPVRVNGVWVWTTEALYQAMRFPGHPELQRSIIEQRNPMRAKMIGKPFRKRLCRSDWGDVRVEIMRWALRLKLAFHPERFGSLLAATCSLPIVEDLGARPASADAVFWGAKPVDTTNQLEGTNMMGQLLAELRDELHAHGLEMFDCVAPPAVPEFLLYDQEITIVTA